MNHHVRRPVLAALLAAAVLLLAATATAIAAGNTITLNLKGGYRNQQRTACTQRNHYTLYHHGGTLRMEGYVSPAPALPDGTWRVKVKIKQCKSGHFVTIWQRHARGNGVVLGGAKVGQFRISYRMQKKGYFFARAYYYGYQPRIRSGDMHFRVTR